MSWSQYVENCRKLGVEPMGSEFGPQNPDHQGWVDKAVKGRSAYATFEAFVTARDIATTQENIRYNEIQLAHLTSELDRLQNQSIDPLIATANKALARFGDKGYVSGDVNCYQLKRICEQWLAIIDILDKAKVAPGYDVDVRVKRLVEACDLFEKNSSDISSIDRKLDAIAKDIDILLRISR